MSASILQLRRDTATNVAAYTPPAAEVLVDTTNYQLHVGDGSTAGGRLVPSFTPAPTNGQIPIGNGTDFVAAVPTAGSGIAITTGSGSLTIAVADPQSSTVANSSTFSTSETYITPTFEILANTLAAGDSFRIRLKGTCTSSTSATCTLNQRLGSAGTTSDAVLTTGTTTSGTANTATNFEIEMYVTVKTIGSSGAAVGTIKVQSTAAGALQGVTAIQLYGTNSLTINTTANLYLGFSMVTGSTNTTVTINMSTVEKIR